MMCDPTTGDLLRGRADRVLPGLRVWRGLRPGGHVHNLSRRVQGSGSGCSLAHRTQASAADAGTLRTYRGSLDGQDFSVFEQQEDVDRVESKRSPQIVTPESLPRTENAMTNRISLPSSSLQVIAERRSPRRDPSAFESDFRRELQHIAGGEHISTGTNPTHAPEGLPRTSVIVLVTSSGNVTVRAN